MRTRAMGWTVVALVIGLPIAAAGPTRAQTAEELVRSKHVMIRHRLEPAGPIYVGQPVRVWIEVMTRTWFLQAPRFPATVEVQNAIVIPPDAFGVNSSERIEGDTYAVQGRSYTIFPQTTGRFEIPPIPVRLVVAREDASPSPEITLQTEPVTTEARLPAGTEGHGRVLSTPSLEVRETYDRPTEGLKVGDSFKRQVTMKIEDSVAMLLPPIAFEAAEGVAVYPGRPDVSDQRNRGSLTGTRVDEATYVMEAEGTYRIPETKLWWWNLRTSSLEQEVLPAVDFKVEVNPDLAAEHLGQPEEEGLAAEDSVATEVSGWSWEKWALVLGSLTFGILAVRKIWQGMGRGRHRAEKKEESGDALFHRFEVTAKSDDPVATYEALLRWLDRFEPVGSPALVRTLVALTNDEKLSRECDTLESELYGPRTQGSETAWSGLALATAVAQARRQLRTREEDSQSLVNVLPSLNP